MGDISLQDSDSYYEISLADGWQFRQKSSTEKEWLPVKKVPSTVHQDLIDNQIIPDPFVGLNELKAEWVGTKAWSYRTTFNAPNIPSGSKAVLVFEGLDTFAHVKLNGTKVLETDNMFLPYSIDVTHHISSRKSQTLEIDFDSALLRAREIETKHPEHRFAGFNGETARMGVRKAQYHWGWDWGPILMCSGVWRPIKLQIYAAKIEDVRIEQELSEDLQSVNLNIRPEISCDTQDDDFSVSSTVSLEGRVVASSGVTNWHAESSCQILVGIKKPKLWMPHGYGEQQLYSLEVKLYKGDSVVHTVTKRIGIRKVELVQDADKHGKSFYFRINGIDIFMGGSCWIPADSFLTNITVERLRSWMELVVAGNQRMIRVWGGGIYEDHAFYDACDELGIMVWQDFMFACGNYPVKPLEKSVEAEAIANVRRLRHHPCLAIFAGNNEDYQVQEQLGLTYDFEDKDEKNWLKTDFPARYFYESLLPRVMASECPSVPYHPGSPWGDGKLSSDPTVGDMHQWNVWHGTQEKYQIFDSLGGRFNSEFGMEAFPALGTIKSFVEHDKDLYPQSHVLDFHNKADGHERRIATYLVENVRMSSATSLEAYIHLTQLVQCEALMYGYRGWRKQWGDNRHCGGALVWQMNDCWPVTSWSICDYYLRRKPAYYTIARALAPVTVGIRRSHYDWSVTHARQPKTQPWELWATTSRLNTHTVDVELRFISVETGKDVKPRILKKGVRLTTNGTTDILKGFVDNVVEEPHILAARIWEGDSIIARDADWPQPLKYLSYPKRSLKVRFEREGSELHVSADRPVKCLVFEERQGCHLSDSAIDVMPGDDQIIKVRGLKDGDDPLSWTFLAAGEQ